MQHFLSGDRNKVKLTNIYQKVRIFHILPIKTEWWFSKSSYNVAQGWNYVASSKNRTLYPAVNWYIKRSHCISSNAQLWQNASHSLLFLKISVASCSWPISLNEFGNMAVHNFLSFLAGDNFCLIIIPTKLFPPSIHKKFRFSLALPFSFLQNFPRNLSSIP